MDCSVYGCIKKQYATGLCHYHYQEQRKANASPCNIDGCDRKSEKAGMCNKHYRQQKLAQAPICTVVGCGRHQNANGYCTTHNMRIQRYGSLDADQRAHDRGARENHHLYQSYRWFIRARAICPEWTADFWAFVGAVGERPSAKHRLRRFNEKLPIGPSNWEWRIAVISTPDHKERQRLWRKKYPERTKGYDLKRDFGIGIEEFNGMLDAQNGVCAICSKPEDAIDSTSGASRHLAVDHCHDTGKIRGLLCTGCNMMVGNCEKHPEVIDGLIAYLKKHKSSLTD